MEISYLDYQVLGEALQEFTHDLPYGALTIIVHKRAPITCEVHLRIDEYFEATEIGPLAEDLLALSQLANAVNRSNCLINWGQRLSEFEGLDEDEAYAKYEENVSELVDILQGAFDSRTARPFSNWFKRKNDESIY